MLNPKVKHFGPLGTGNTLVSLSVLKMHERKSVVSSNQVSNLPHKHNTAEKPSQTDGVKRSHIVLSLFSVALEDDQNNHHNGDNSTGGTDNGEPFDHFPDAVVLGEEKCGLVGGGVIETEGIALLLGFGEDSSSVEQVNWEFLYGHEVVLVAGQVGDLWSEIGVIDVEVPFVLGVSEVGLIISTEDTVVTSLRGGHVEEFELLKRRSWVTSGVHAFKCVSSGVPLNTNTNSFGVGGLSIFRQSLGEDLDTRDYIIGGDRGGSSSSGSRVIGSSSPVIHVGGIWSGPGVSSICISQPSTNSSAWISGDHLPFSNWAATFPSVWNSETVITTGNYLSGTTSGSIGTSET